jgi:hypothetical protein
MLPWLLPLGGGQVAFMTAMPAGCDCSSVLLLLLLLPLLLPVHQLHDGPRCPQHAGAAGGVQEIRSKTSCWVFFVTSDTM